MLRSAAKPSSSNELQHTYVTEWRDSAPRGATRTNDFQAVRVLGGGRRRRRGLVDHLVAHSWAPSKAGEGAVLVVECSGTHKGAWTLHEFVRSIREVADDAVVVVVTSGALSWNPWASSIWSCASVARNERAARMALIDVENPSDESGWERIVHEIECESLDGTEVRL
jgi:hypothetical protein